MITMSSHVTQILIVTTCLIIGYSFVACKQRKKKLANSKPCSKAYEQLIGNTALVELSELSKLTNRRIFAKMECMNPGGTGKDRAAKYMLMSALNKYYTRSDGSSSSATCNPIPEVTVVPPIIFEGTSGSTGIALACLCNAMELELHVVMPDDQADEKRLLLETLGVIVTIVPCCSISNKNHYVNTARRMAKEADGIFLDQFENLSNFEAHFEETGPEIWVQTGGSVDAFVMSAGTGGTIAGVSRFLKSKKPSVRVVLADPVGSSLFHRVMHGVCYTAQQAEKTIKKHRYDSIVEGVGLDRVTRNFQLASIDSAERISDQEILDTAHWLLEQEGLFVGSSSAMNVAAACRVAMTLPEGSVIVTVICDSGQRHMSRFWNPEYILKYSLSWPLKHSSPHFFVKLTGVK